MVDDLQETGWTYANGLLHAPDDQDFRIEAVELSGGDAAVQLQIGLAGEQHPSAYFQAVGRGTTAFGRIEAALEGLFGDMLDAPQPSAAQSILRAASNFNARARIIDAVSKVALDGENLDQARSLMQRAKVAADKRNILAHGSVRATIDMRQSPAVHSILLHASGDTLGLEAIVSFGTECWQLSDDLIAFTVRLRDGRSSLSE